MSARTRVSPQQSHPASSFGLFCCFAPCFRVGKTSNDASTASRTFSVTGGNTMTQQDDLQDTSFARLTEEIVSELKDIPWSNLEAKVLLYYPLIEHGRQGRSANGSHFLKAYCPKEGQEKDLSCPYVTSEGHFLKRKSDHDRGDILVVPGIPGNKKEELISMLHNKGYAASFSIMNLEKILKQRIDVPCLLVKW